MIYFLENPTEKRIKIGYTNRIPRRQREVEKQSATTLTLLGIMKGNRSDESILHAQFSEWRIEREWFRDCESIRTFIQANTKQPTLQTENETNPRGFKSNKLEQIKRLLLMHPDGISITDIQQAVDPKSDWSSIWRYVTRDLEARKIERGIYTLDPSESDIALAIAVLDRTG